MITHIKKIPVLLSAVILSLSLYNMPVVLAADSRQSHISELPDLDPLVSDPPDSDLPVSDPPDSDLPVSDPPDSDPPVSDPPDSDLPNSDPPVSDPPDSDLPNSDLPVSDPPDSDLPEASTSEDGQQPADTDTNTAISLSAQLPESNILNSPVPSMDNLLLKGTIDWKEAATFDELKELLRDSDWVEAGGCIRVTGDLVIPPDEYCTIWPGTSADMPLIIDLGEHTLFVEGRLWSFGSTKFIGSGGENGLIRVRTGGNANIRSTVFEVTEEGGYAIWQENNSTLLYTPVDGSVGEIHFSEMVEAQVSTFEELTELLNDSTLRTHGGHITATSDLVVPTGEEHKIGLLCNSLTTLDMGKHILFVEGSLTIYEWVQLTGAGSENSMLRLKTGGELNIYSATLTVPEGSYAIWQEEGSLFQYFPGEATVGEVHFAEMPVALPYSISNPLLSLPVAVVHDGQTPEDVLPVSDNAKLYWRGGMESGTHDDPNLIPVVWDLEPYQEQLNAGKRVMITGSYPGVTAFQTPICLVVFQNGNPATFLYGRGEESKGQPMASLTIELADPELGCRFEWSQDGRTWLPADFRAVSNEDGPLRFQVTFSQEAPPVYPYYLSAVVDYPDGSVGYSDVIVFTESEGNCDSGGARGGGTSIISPPDRTSGHSTGYTSSSESETPAKSEITAESKPDIPAAEEITIIRQAPPPAKAEPNLQALSQMPSKSDDETPLPKPDGTENHISRPAAPMPIKPAKEPPVADTAALQPDLEERSPFVKAVPIIIGGTAAATGLGAAGVYYSQHLRKRILYALKKFLQIKK